MQMQYRIQPDPLLHVCHIGLAGTARSLYFIKTENELRGTLWYWIQGRFRIFSQLNILKYLNQEQRKALFMLKIKYILSNS